MASLYENAMRRQHEAASRNDPTVAPIGPPYWGSSGLITTIGLKGVRERLAAASDLSSNASLLQMMAHDPDPSVRSAAQSSPSLNGDPMEQAGQNLRTMAGYGEALQNGYDALAKGDKAGAVVLFRHASEGGMTMAQTKLIETLNELGEVREAKKAAAQYPKAAERIRAQSGGATAGSAADDAKKSGCYIATAVYGSYDAGPVMVLRRFRDERLAGSRIGRTAIRCYYAVSPPLADRLRDTTWLNARVRWALDIFVARLERVDPRNGSGLGSMGGPSRGTDQPGPRRRST